MQTVRAELVQAKQQAVVVPAEEAPATLQPIASEATPNAAAQLPEENTPPAPPQEDLLAAPALASPSLPVARSEVVASPRLQPRAAKSSSSSLAAAASYAAVAAPAPATARPAKRLPPTQFHSRTEEAEEELDDLSSLNCCASCSAPSFGYMVITFFVRLLLRIEMLVFRSLALVARSNFMRVVLRSLLLSRSSSALRASRTARRLTSAARHRHRRAIVQK